VADSGKSCPASCNGNDPVNPSTGGEYLFESDIPGIGPRHPLSFGRFYNSLDTTAGDLGSNWRHDYSRKLTLEYSYPRQLPPSPTTSSLYSDQATACTSGFAEIRSKVPGLQTATASYSNSLCTLSVGGAAVTTIPVYDNSGQYNPSLSRVHAYRDDGHILNFGANGSTFTAEAGVSARLTVVTGGYQLTDESDNAELYDSTGKLLSVTDRVGNTQTLTYNANTGLLSSIADNFGHNIGLGYDGQSRLHTVTGPNGLSVIYDYDNGGHLWKITNADGSSNHQFLYQDANWPNGISSLVDENGQVQEIRMAEPIKQNVGLNEAAMASARSARYKPATRDGVRVKMWTRLRIPFKL